MELFKYNTDISNVSCSETFLSALKIQFDEFAQYYNNELYFSVDTLQSEVQDFVDNFNCDEAKQIVADTVLNSADIVKNFRDPTISENPSETGLVWINEITGDSFICTNNTLDANVWVGMKTGRLIRPVPPADKFDFFDDDSCVLFSELNGNANDVGGLYNGVETSIYWEPAFDHKVASSRNNGTIKFNNLPFNSSTEAVTLSAWVYWNGNNAVMPFGWRGCDLWCESGNLGFNTFHSDLFGVDYTEYKNKWVYLSVIFEKNAIGRIFINGVEQTLSEKRPGFAPTSMKMDSTLSIFGSNVGSGYRQFGSVGRVRVFNRALTPEEVGAITQAEVDMITYIGGTV